MNTVGRIEQLSISPSGTRAGLRIDFAESGPVTIVVYARENADALYCAQHGADFRSVLWELQEHFLRRKVNKGEHDYKSASEALEAV